MRYRLRTLMIVLALGPPLLAGVWPIARHFLRPATSADLSDLLEAVTHITLIDDPAWDKDLPPLEPGP